MKSFSNRLLIGTYTNKKRGGIYLTEFSGTGSLNILQHINDADNPSYIAVSPKKNFIVAVNEGAGQAATVSSYKLEGEQLSFINKVHAGGDHPCYVSIHEKGEWAAVANYTGGNMTVFPLKKNGTLQQYVHEIHHTGSGTFSKRQEKPHAHAAVFHNNELYLTDLSLDKVFYYRFQKNKQLPLHSVIENTIAMQPGSGPRHLAFHPKTNDLYVIEELIGAVSFYKRSEGYKFNQRIICTSDTKSEDKGSADIHISPDGKFLYASNRATANNIAAFSIATDGKLNLITHINTGGEQPRNFVIHPSGDFLLAANQRTDNIVVFKRNKTDGMLEKLNELSVPNPVCLKFI